MSSILDRIIADKKLEIRKRKEEIPIRLLEKSPHFNRNSVSFKASLTSDGASGIIAEFKRMSPSAGWINRNADAAEVTRGYVQAGATALSVLTDHKYFAGSGKDLSAAREKNRCPILQKDFIVDPYQVFEAKSLGADAILLIASVLDASAILTLAQTAGRLEMEVLLEIHDASEMANLHEGIDMVGVNNRNLMTMETDVQTSIDLAAKIPDEFLKISESGIHDPETIDFLKRIGYKGFLIGEYFMKHEDPAKACRKFIERIQKT